MQVALKLGKYLSISFQFQMNIIFLCLSGQQVLGPKKTKKPEAIIKDLFEKARE